jgi:hypothetical protein
MNKLVKHTEKFLPQNSLAGETSKQKSCVSEKFITFATMKTIRFFIVIVLLCFATQSKAQIVYTNQNFESGLYIINSNKSTIHSQKILTYDSNNHIVMAQIVNADSSLTTHFFMVINGKDRSVYLNVPVEFKVKDFTILGDTLYFCGNTFNNSYTAFAHQDSLGFIAQFNIPEAFGGELHCLYSIVPLTFDIKRIEAYYKQTEHEQMPIVAGIGSQYYSEPPIYKTNFPEPQPDEPCNNCNPPYNKSINTMDFEGPDVDIQPPQPYWDYSDTNHWYYDCFVLYKVYPTYDSVEDYYYNEVNVYRHENSRTDSTLSLSKKYLYEKFKDITITDDYICIVSAYDFNVIGWTGASNRIIVRRFDKNTYVQHSEQLYYTWTPIRDYLGFKVEALDSNYVAVGYVEFGETSSGYSNWRNVVFTANLRNNQTDSMEFIHASKVFDANKMILQDMEYLPEKDSLLVLAYNSGYTNGNPDRIYYVYVGDVEPGLMWSYPSHYIVAPVEEEGYKWSNILRYDRERFVVTGIEDEGNNKGTLHFFDRKTYTENLNTECYIDVDTVIVGLEVNWFYSFDNLIQCRELYEVVESIGMPDGVNYHSRLVARAFAYEMLLEYNTNRVVNKCKTLSDNN